MTAKYRVWVEVIIPQELVAGSQRVPTDYDLAEEILDHVGSGTEDELRALQDFGIEFRKGIEEL